MNKDLADQLRVVHLSLLLICLILVAANLAEQRGPLKLAYDDAVKINELVGHYELVRAAVMKEALHDYAVEHLHENTEPPDVSAAPYAHVTISGKVIYTLDRRDQFLAGHPANHSPEDLQSLNELSLNVYWSTFEAFINSWENSPPIIPNPLRYRKEFSRQLELATNCGVRAILTPATKVAATIFASAIVYDRVTRETALAVPFDDPLKRTEDGLPKRCEVRMPLGTVQDLEVDIRAVIRDAARAHWTPSPFKDAFPNLYDSTKYLTSLTLPQLVNHLREESTKEGEKVEMFGTKIPYELVSIFGSVFLLACQLYLLCHLIEFTNRLRAGSKEQEFTGYIGLYDDQAVARMFTILSVSLIPAAVLVFAIWRNRISVWSWLTPGIALPFSLLLGSLLVRGFYRLWSVKRTASQSTESPESVKTSSEPGNGQPLDPVPAEASPSSGADSSPPLQIPPA